MESFKAGFAVCAGADDVVRQLSQPPKRADVTLRVVPEPRMEMIREMVLRVRFERHRRLKTEDPNNDRRPVAKKDQIRQTAAMARGG